MKPWWQSGEAPAARERFHRAPTVPQTVLQDRSGAEARINGGRGTLPGRAAELGLSLTSYLNLNPRWVFLKKELSCPCSSSQSNVKALNTPSSFSFQHLESVHLGWGWG